MLMKTALRNLSLLQKHPVKTNILMSNFPIDLCRNALIRSFRRQFLSQWTKQPTNQPTNQPTSDAAGGSTSTMVEKWAWKWSTRYLQAQVPLKPIACASFCFFWANGGGGGGFFRDFFYTFPSLPSGFIMFHLVLFLLIRFLSSIVTDKSNVLVFSDSNSDSARGHGDNCTTNKHMIMITMIAVYQLINSIILYMLAGSLWSLSIHVCLKLA